MRSKSSQSGLTLLEILVALAMLSIVMGVIYSTFFSANKTSALLESDEDVYQTARSLLEMLSEELRAARYYEDPATQKGFGLKGKDTEADSHSADTLSFLSNAHRRSTSDAKEGDLVEIGYFFDIDEINGTKRLIRSEDTSVDFDFEEGGKLLILTDRVQELNITYFNSKKEEWVNEWDAETEKKLPDLVRIELSILNDLGGSVPFRSTIQPTLVR